MRKIMSLILLMGLTVASGCASIDLLARIRIGEDRARQIEQEEDPEAGWVNEYEVYE